MAFLGPLASLLGIELEVLAERLRRQAGIIAVIALFAAIGGIFLLVAAQIGLSVLVGPLWAALIIAGTALLIAFAVWVGARIAGERRRKREAAARRASETTALATTAALTALPLLVRNPAMRLAAIPVGAVLGYLMLRRGRRDPGDDRDS